MKPELQEAIDRILAIDLVGVPYPIVSAIVQLAVAVQEMEATEPPYRNAATGSGEQMPS